MEDHELSSPDWRILLSEASLLGQTMQVSRNADAIVSHNGPCPYYRFSSCGTIATDSHSGSRLMLEQWESARVRTEKVRAGTTPSLEFLNSRGDVFHKIVVTADSNMAAFQRMLKRCNHPSQMPDPSRMSPAHKRHSSTGMMKLATDEVFLGHGGSAVYRIIESICQSRETLSVFLPCAGMTRQVSFTPREIRTTDGWIFCSNGYTAFHLSMTAAHSVWLGTFASGRSRGTHLEALDEDGKTVIRFHVDGTKAYQVWNSLFRG